MEEQEIHLRNYWRVIYKRRGTVLTFFIVLVVVVAIGSLTTTPIYRATTKMLIERENPNIINLRDMYYFDTYEDYYQTQYEIIKSTAVAEKVVKNLSLDRNPEFNTALRHASRGLLGSIIYGIKGLFHMDNAQKTTSEPVQITEETELALAKQILGPLKVEPIKNSHIINISYEYRDPRLAAAIADGVAQAYMQQMFDIKMGVTKETIGWMTDKIEEQKKKLEDSENALYAYMKGANIADIESKGGSATPQKLQELATQLVMAETKRKDAEALYNQVKGLSDSPDRALVVPEVAADPVVQSLRANEIKTETEIMELKTKFGEKHPKMIRLREDLKAIKDREASEVKRVIAAIKSNYELTRSKEANLRSLLGENKAEAIALSEKSIQYSMLKRDVETNQQIYETLLKRLKETSLTEGAKSINIWVVDKAEVPKGPISPRMQMNIMLAIIVGLFGGVGIAFFLEYLDNTIKTPEDVEEKLKLPFLGAIPKIRLDEVTGGKIEGLPHTDPKSTISEAYRAIRTGLLLSSTERPYKKLMAASLAPDEGKTATVLNLAITIAQTDKSVVIVDADLRKPKMHLLFDRDNRLGLSNYLAGLTELKTILKETYVPGLSVITSGPLPPDPAELISSRRMKELLQGLTGDFDVIIIDSPPLLPVTDAAILSSHADGVILIVKGGKTTVDMIKRGIKALSDINAKIIGVVINAVDMDKEDYYLHYYPYHQYYYGDREKKDENDKE